ERPGSRPASDGRREARRMAVDGTARTPRELRRRRRGAVAGVGARRSPAATRAGACGSPRRGVVV
ncbi:MAG: hypothetical protein AVDCRST_MAG45-2189, partial [uncultured Solirubrobacterales bacterium]